MIYILHLDQDVHRHHIVTNVLSARGWEYELVPGVPGSILQAYIDMETRAVDEGWDLDDIVMQDDVHLPPVILRDTDVEVMSYGMNRVAGHACPKAYAATPAGHQALKDALLNQDPEVEHPACQAFTVVVTEMGMSLGQAKDVFFPKRFVREND